MTSSSAATRLWSPAPASLHLAPNDVHVWLAPLDVSPRLLEALAATLSAEEQARADRFYFQRDRRRSVCARGILRDILARYLNCDPGELQFRYGPHGKTSGA